MEEDLIFERISSEVLVDHPWHRYRRDRYRLRDGAVGDYYYIDIPGSCGIIPLFEDGTTMLLRVERYLLGRHLWEFPIGGMGEGEDPREVAEKELAEEAGLEAERWTFLGSFAPYKGASNERCRFFLAEGLRSVRRAPEPSERIRVERVPLQEAFRRLLEQELPDGQSLCGWLLLQRYLGGGRSPGDPA